MFGVVAARLEALYLSCEAGTTQNLAGGFTHAMTGPGQSPQAAARRALADAYEQAVKAEAEKRTRAAVMAKKSKVRRVVLGVAWLISLTGATLLVLKPGWFGLVKYQESAAERDANIRLSLYMAGQQLEAYRQRTGSFPDRLDQAGRTVPGIQYQRTPDGGYEMRLSRGGQMVLLTSRDSLNAFLGSSLARVVPSRPT